MKSSHKPDVSQALDRRPQQTTDMTMFPMAGAVQTKASQYQTALAVQVPRDMARVKGGVVYESAQMRESWLYSWKVANKDEEGKGTVEGETIDAAMVLARNFGNCAIPCQLSDETPTHWTFEAVFIDLETGFSVQRLYRQRKPTSGAGRMTRERLEDAAFSIGVSKAQRNAILKAMPQWLLDAARAAAKNAAAEPYRKADALQKAITNWKGWLAKKGVSDERVVARIGRPYEEWTGEDIVLLKTIGNALQEGLTTLDQEFPPIEPVGAPEKPERQPGEDDVPAAGTDDDLTF